MKRKLILACAATLLATPVFAQTTSVGLIDERVLQLMDSNGDGAVTRAEMQAYAERAFTQLDTNGNGRLEPSETSQILSASQFQIIDKDGNGWLSKKEFTDQLMADFASADKNGDGMLR
ncbi:hypothetical protein CDV50_09985 [Haematobacter massiliensis]|uniref:Signal peptide protein n=1 Tax=Haematobacter massiliensis TaxID=195105 RepID=A0A086Y8Q3_9RHOB|nr:hypothetical protein [Haematobacter massiliensis]KFI30653.1 signal peptide protein [Haematobacter massiliensis]OWJ71539.1 hypothetical protein CDV50_09985 [Haematobacter massiliensis]OWJ83469.1 hypothetical protein CDV51_15965 [Haematobacter massiliensis]QBJ25117.1 EF-hand domain-containing protein [Haematobacter massiliensis]